MIVRGVTTIAQSTVANNSASGIGGGIRLQANTGGGSSLSLVNSTVSGNSADLRGSGIAANAPLSIFFSTIASNTGQASGVQVDSGSLTIENSILANNDNSDCAASAPIVGIFSSLVADGSCGVVNDGDNIVADPLLGSLADNGGPTLTHSLLLNSPAIGDADEDDCPSIDQRGFLRDVVPCDMGAFEAGGVPTAVAVRQSGTTAAPSITLLLLALCLTAITIKLRLPLR